MKRLPLLGLVEPCAFRNLTFLLSLLVAGVVSSPTSAQGFQGVEPGQPFPIDIESGVISATLPFDVHFFLTDEVSDAVTSVEGRVLGFKTAQTCEAALAKSPNCESPDGSVVDCHRLEKAAIRGEPGKRSFELLVTPLQPNRHYCFEILIPSDFTSTDEKNLVLAAMSNAIVKVMNQSFWFTPENIHGTAPLEQLRADLLAAARKSMGPGKIIVPEEGSFFDEKVPVTKFGAEVGDQVSRFLTSQFNVPDVRSALQQRALTASGALKRLSTSPLWRITSEALHAHATQPRVSQLLAQREKALELIGLPETEVVARSQGHTGTLDNVWVAEQLDLESLRRQLNDLRTIADTLAADEDLRQAIGLDEATLAEQVKAECGITNFASDTICDADPVSPRFFQMIQKLARDTSVAFDSSQNEGLEAAVENLKGVLRARSDRLQRLVTNLSVLLLRVVNLRASTVAEYETRATWYVGADLGAAFAWEVNEAFTYGGANVYFRPVNKKAHLRMADWKRGQIWTEFRKRFSVTLGIPRDEIQIENIQPLIQNRPGIIGVGWRLNDFLRVTVGTLVFKEKDPNPLIDNEQLAYSYFGGLSIDWNIAGTFKTMFGSVFGGNQPPGAK